MKYYVKNRISENISQTPEGFLICPGVPIARTGEQIYGDFETELKGDANGIVKVQRDESEVFRPQTIASFNGKPVTIQHPDDFVNPKNWSELAKGVVQNARRGEGDQKNDLLADLLITDDEAIKLIKKGLRQVSCGYDAEYEQISDGQGRQTNIIGNHVALVEEGRAGPDYAIKDHKLKGEKMSMKEKMKKLLAKFSDEAEKIAKDEEPKFEEKKDEEKKDAYDDLVKMCGDLSEKLEAFSKSKDEDPEKEEKKDEEKPEEKKDEEKPEKSMDDRLKALEDNVAQLMEKQSKDADEDKDDEEPVDEEKKKQDNPDDEYEDDDFSESSMVGDEKSRVEILAPGLSLSKTFKADALKAAWKNKEGKKAIETLTGKKELVLDSADRIDSLFVAASELLKHTRNKSLAGTRQVKDQDNGPVYKTAEQINEINAKFYAKPTLN